MLTLQMLMYVALAAQLPLIGLAFLLEFSRRKRRVIPQRQPVSPPAQQPAVEETQPPAPSEEAVQAPPATETVEAPRPAVQPSTPVIAVEQAEAVPATREESIETAVSRESEVEAAPRAPEPAQQAPKPLPSAPAAVDEIAAPIPAAAREAEVPPAAVKAPARIGLGLRKTRENFLARIRAAITGNTQVEEIYEGLEEALIGADVGVEASTKITQAVRSQLKNDARADVIREALKAEIAKVLRSVDRPLADSGDDPLVIMLAGVNGVGKTTTVAKLAALLKSERGTVVVAAADTFRAAAIEQLQVWCDRIGVDLVKQKQGSDPAAVAFDAVKAAAARRAAAVIIDTAGRLQTKVNLMEELKKVARVVGRELKGAPHETWLVLDATTGQNALSQAKIFGDAVPLTGVVLAKLDSTAKGGVIIGIADRMKVPVRYVGVGEALDDLRVFDASEFVEGLFSEAVDSREAGTGTYAA